jgi:hypothetical protein
VVPDQILQAEQTVSFLQKGTLEETKYKVKDGALQDPWNYIR